MERLQLGLIAVAWREVQWIWRDRVALFLVVGVPLLAFALLSLTFSNAVVRDLIDRARKRIYQRRLHSRKTPFRTTKRGHCPRSYD